MIDNNFVISTITIHELILIKEKGGTSLQLSGKLIGIWG